MQKYAFKMRLNPGCEEEYMKRHDDIWPELVGLLKDAGISDYSRPRNKYPFWRPLADR